MVTGTNAPLWLMGDHDRTDHDSGSTSQVANNNGTPYTNGNELYKPWGEKRYPTGASGLPTTYRFTGQRQDSYINLYWYGSRWYDDSLGRFIQPDTDVPESQGVQALDRFAYANNNPVRYKDPSGHSVDGDGDYNHPTPAPTSGDRCAASNGYAPGCSGARGSGSPYPDPNDPQYSEWNSGEHECAACHYAKDSGYTILTNAQWADAQANGEEAIKWGAAAFAVGTGGAFAVDAAASILPVAGAACADGDCTNEASAAANNIDKIANDVSNWVSQGDDLITIRNKAGDFILRNAENTRRFQFHFYNDYPEGAPHMHLDFLNDAGEWIKTRIFPSN